MAELIPEHSDRCLSALQKQNRRYTDPGRDCYSVYLHNGILSSATADDSEAHLNNILLVQFQNNDLQGH